jgi:hypothetical protein
MYIPLTATRCCQMSSPIRPLPQADCYILSSIKFFVTLIRIPTLHHIISMMHIDSKHSAVNSLLLAQNSPLVTVQSGQQMPLFGSDLV